MALSFQTPRRELQNVENSKVTVFIWVLIFLIIFLGGCAVFVYFFGYVYFSYFFSFSIFFFVLGVNIPDSILLWVWIFCMIFVLGVKFNLLNNFSLGVNLPCNKFSLGFPRMSFDFCYFFFLPVVFSSCSFLRQIETRVHY